MQLLLQSTKNSSDADWHLIEAYYRRNVSMPVEEQKHETEKPATELTPVTQIHDVGNVVIESYQHEAKKVTTTELVQETQRQDETVTSTNSSNDTAIEEYMAEGQKLHEIENRAMELVQEFQRSERATTPFHSSNGAIRFAYSNFTPRITCSPMRVTDIMLQAGEVVTGIHAGDTARWTFFPSTSGIGDNTVTHVMVKPLASDISTNLIVHTNRRVYNFELISSAKESFGLVTFSYPEDEMQELKVFIENKRAKGRL